MHQSLDEISEGRDSHRSYHQSGDAVDLWELYDSPSDIAHAAEGWSFQTVIALLLSASTRWVNVEVNSTRETDAVYHWLDVLAVGKAGEKRSEVRFKIQPDFLTYDQKLAFLAVAKKWYCAPARDTYGTRLKHIEMALALPPKEF